METGGQNLWGRDPKYYTTFYGYIFYYGTVVFYKLVTFAYTVVFAVGATFNGVISYAQKDGVNSFSIQEIVTGGQDNAYTAAGEISLHSTGVLDISSDTTIPTLLQISDGFLRVTSIVNSGYCGINIINKGSAATASSVSVRAPDGALNLQSPAGLLLQGSYIYFSGPFQWPTTTQITNCQTVNLGSTSTNNTALSIFGGTTGGVPILILRANNLICNLGVTTHNVLDCGMNGTGGLRAGIIYTAPGGLLSIGDVAIDNTITINSTTNTGGLKLVCNSGGSPLYTGSIYMAPSGAGMVFKNSSGVGIVLTDGTYTRNIIPTSTGITMGYTIVSSQIDLSTGSSTPIILPATSTISGGNTSLTIGALSANLAIGPAHSLKGSGSDITTTRAFYITGTINTSTAGITASLTYYVVVDKGVCTFTIAPISFNAGSTAIAWIDFPFSSFIPKGTIQIATCIATSYTSGSAGYNVGLCIFNPSGGLIRMQAVFNGTSGFQNASSTAGVSFSFALNQQT